MWSSAGEAAPSGPERLRPALQKFVDANTIDPTAIPPIPRLAAAPTH